MMIMNLNLILSKKLRESWKILVVEISIKE